MLLGVDVGGTFTDAVLLGEDWTLHTAKVLTTPLQESIGVLEAVEPQLREQRGGAAARCRARDVGDAQRKRSVVDGA